MRFVVFSDLHLNRWSYGSSLTKEGRNSRLRAQVDVCKQIRDFMVSRDITHLMFTGDFFHTHSTLHVEVLDAAMEIAGMFSMFDTYFLVGNHDQSDREGKLHSLEILKPYVHVIDDTLSTAIEGIPCSFLSYTEDADRIRSFLSNTPEGSYVFMHQGIGGVPVNSKGFVINESLTADMIPNHIRAAFVGHYHSNRQVSNRIWIPGSPMPHTWTDAGEERGWLDVRSDRDEIVLVPSKSPLFVHIKNICSIEAYRHLLSECKGNYVRLDIPDRGWDISLIRQEALDNGALSVEVRIEDKASTSVDGPEFLSLPDLFTGFCKQNNLSPEIIRAGKELMKGIYSAPALDESKQHLLSREDNDTAS